MSKISIGYEIDNSKNFMINPKRTNKFSDYDNYPFSLFKYQKTYMNPNTKTHYYTHQNPTNIYKRKYIEQNPKIKKINPVTTTFNYCYI